MADIELVIKIPEEDYESIKDDAKKFLSMPAHKVPSLYKAINEGTPLPKGHGRLVDVSKLHRRIEHNLDGTIFSYVPYIDIDTAQTIIEADKGGE